MKVSVKNGKPCQKILKIEVDPAQIKQEYDAFYKAIAPKAKVPGFRPGKAPQSVLAMHYKEEAKKEVLNQLIHQSFREALKDEALEPLGYPTIEDVQFSEEKLTYQAQVEIRPKIKLSKVTGLRAGKETSTVQPQEVEEALEQIRKSQAQYKPVEERPAAKGDLVVADYVCKVGDQEIDKRVEDWIPIRDEEYLKNFSVQLIGVKPEDEKEIRVVLPEDFARKEWAGKEAVFNVKVKEIKAELLPALDDELAKSAGEFQTLEELRAKVRKDLLETKERNANAAYERALLDELIKQNKMDLPEGLVARRLERLVEDALQHYTRHGYPKEKLEEMTKDLRSKLEPEAKRQIHIAFLLDEIALEEDLKALPEDFKRRHEELAARVRQPLEAVERYYAENEDARDGLAEQIRNEKAMEWLKTHAKDK